MTKELLDSDRVNYLIWRYLLESDYRETAARLQKEWSIQDPRQLPFAAHVDNHALVAVLNRGLLYSAQERELTKEHQDAAEAPFGLFGPLMPSSLPAADEDHENVRKRTIDSEQPQNQSGPPGKKARLSNGYENVFDATPMDIDDDQNGDENAYPSPEQLPSPVLATNGPEQGTQVDKVNELSSETVFLELSEDPTSRNTILLQCEFNPRDPMILAAAGTDALARMWTLSRGNPDSGSDSPGKPVFAPHHNLLDENAPPTTTVTGISWSSDGSYIAISSEPIEDGTAKIEFWYVDASPLASFSGFDSPVICLRWNSSNTACLALSPQDEGKGTLLTVMYPAKAESTRFSLSNHTLHDQLLDAAWTDEDEFCICGGDILQAFQCSENGIIAGKKLETRPGEALSRVTYDWHSRLLATASDSGTIDIWDYSGQCRSFNAHQGLITSLSWQPLKTPRALGDDMERLLASAGEDGAISIWNARSSDTKSRCSMTMGSAVVALSFTPDGAFIAGGTNEHVFIWKVDDFNLPRATWTRGDELGWRTPQSHDSAAEEDQFSLSWDANGQKLTYGVNSRLAIINFQP